MPIKVACKSCEVQLNIKDDLAGKSIKCPKCQAITKVPASMQETSVPAAKKTLPDSKAAGKAAGSGSKTTATQTTSKANKKSLPPEEEEDDRPARSAKKSKSLPAKSSKQRVEELEEDRGEEADEKTEAPEYSIPERYEEQLKSELTKGEKLIWCGQPSRRVVMIRSLLVSIGGAVFFLIFLVVSLVMAFKGGRGDFGMLLMLLPIGFVFLIVGAVAPFYQAWKAARTCYALTNRRCIVWQCQWHGGVIMTTYTPLDLMNMWRRDMWFFAQGAGDVVFKTRTVTTVSVNRSRHGSSVSSSTTTYYYGFLSVENVGPIEKLIRETLLDKMTDRLVM